MAPSQSMAGKTVVITGPTLGIGREAARALAAQGASLGLVCRDVAKGQALAAELTAAGATGAMTVIQADMSSQASIRAGAAEVLRHYPRIDVLVNNAGAMFTARHVTADGLEMTFATNHLGYFLFTHLLLDRLKASAPARIVNVASGAHHRGTMNWDDLQSERGYAGLRVYCQSKLANILFTYELARRLAGTNVTVNCLHPGFVASGFGKNDGLLMKIGVTIAGAFTIGPVTGAKTTIYLASSPDVEGITGKYFYKCREARSSRESRDETAARRLWDVSTQLCKLA